MSALSNQDQLLLANQQMARQSMGHRYEALDWKLIQGRRDECARHEQIHPWRISRDNFLLLPKILPSLPETVDYYRELIDGLELGQGIKQYLDVLLRYSFVRTSS